MKSVIENVNQIVWIKNELKNILNSIGKSPSDRFDTYESLLREGLEEMKAKTYAILGE